MNKPIIHSIHCRGYRGCNVGFDDSDCDCGATIKDLTARLSAAEAAIKAAEMLDDGQDVDLEQPHPRIVSIVAGNRATIKSQSERLAEAEAHEQQTHERLGAILGTETSLEDAAKRMAEQLTECRRLLREFTKPARRWSQTEWLVVIADKDFEAAKAGGCDE